MQQISCRHTPFVIFDGLEPRRSGFEYLGNTDFLEVTTWNSSSFVMVFALKCRSIWLDYHGYGSVLPIHLNLVPSTVKQNREIILQKRLTVCQTVLRIVLTSLPLKCFAQSIRILTWHRGCLCHVKSYMFIFNWDILSDVNCLTWNLTDSQKFAFSAC